MKMMYKTKKKYNKCFNKINRNREIDNSQPNSLLLKIQLLLLFQIKTDFTPHFFSKSVI